MSKRSLDEDASQLESDSNAHSKRPRNFIASVACETCRLKKTRCDESRPKCSLCKSLDIDCVYNERKTSKRDQSMGMIMSTLHRLETKMENMPSIVCQDLQWASGQMMQAIQALKVAREPEAPPPVPPAPTPAFVQTTTPLLDDSEELGRPALQDAVDSSARVSISFSQHGVISWPGAREILPRDLLAAHEALGRNYVVELERRHPPLPMYIRPFPAQADERWLEALPLALIKGLSDAFFTTFNPFTPIMDKNFYFSFTLGAAIESGFGYTVESCLVLNVMALGCLAVQAHREGDFPLPGSRTMHFEPPEWIAVVYEEPPGLRFFNEARRRIGFLMCENDLQSCQFYLLSSVYYSQILRPMDWWAMIHRAATCCLSMLTNEDVNFDEWEGDMKSRVFWNCLMNETILVQELPLPPSGLSRLEDVVPIPKFIGFESTGFVPARLPSAGELDDSFFQYHFLAQVAHRIILTRIRHSLYFFSDSGTFPSPAINAELHHQLEQWRINLPPALRFSASEPPATPGTSRHPSTVSPVPVSPSTSMVDDANHRPLSLSLPLSLSISLSISLSPATAVAEAMLRGRYAIAKFHIGRPYLYKALRAPNALTDDDLSQVRSGLRYAMDWPIVQGLFTKMTSCIPLKFAFCSQFFGQILLFYCISHSPSSRVRNCLPRGWERWNEDMLRFLEECAPYSPAVAQDLELLRRL